MRILELFSGTHSIGKCAKKRGHKVVSLDRDIGASCPFGSGYISKEHIICDIMDWDYTIYPVGHFDLITASPVCLWWSHIRYSMIGRKLKGMDRRLTQQDIDDDIQKFGVPMVDKIFEILDYYKPKHFWIENPQTGRMKEYIDPLIPYYDVDYCKYGIEYKKRTRIWTNIPNFEPSICNMDCNFVKSFGSQTIHTTNLASSCKVLIDGKIITLNSAEKRRKYKGIKKIKLNDKKHNKYDRYRIPFKLVEKLLVAWELNS